MTKTIDEITKEINLNPNDYSLYFKRANTYFNNSEYKEAIKDYDKAIEIDSKYTDTYNNKGIALNKLNKFEEAIEQYNKAIEIDPNYADAYNNKGFALDELNKSEEAIEQYDKAIKINKDDANVYYNKGIALSNLNRFEEAIEQYDKAIEIESDFADAYNNKGIALKNLNRFEEAIEQYDKAIEIDKNYADPYNNKGTALYKLNRSEEAITEYDKAIEIDKDDAQAYNNKGIALSKLNRFEEAILQYDQAIEINPNSVDIYYNKGTALDKLNRFGEAIEQYDKSIQINPDYANAYNNKGVIQEKLNNFKEAIEEYSKAIEIDPDYAETYFNKGSALEDLNRFEQAIEMYEKAIELFNLQGKHAYANMAQKRLEKVKKDFKYSKRNSQSIPAFISDIDKLMNDGRMKYIEKRSKANEASFIDFIREEQEKTEEQKVKKEEDAGEDPIFHCLRRWNSYTPIIADNFYSSKGGGYFISFDDKGIVIDPGFNFIDNFQEAGFKFYQITDVFITHSHNDHTADLESLLTLLYKYNDYIKGGPEDDINSNSLYALAREDYENLRPEDKNRTSIEEIYKDKLSRSNRIKKINIYMTVSTFKKYSNFLDLNSKNDYTINIIDSTSKSISKTYKDKKLIISPLKAHHNDILSDRDSIGFSFAYKNKIIIYTGDTGFNKDIEDFYTDFKNKNKDKSILLLAHIGGFKPYEKYYKDNLDSEKYNYEAFYKNHLGRLGLARLVEILEPDICIISEFGEEFRHCRKELTSIYQDIYPNTSFFPR